MNDDVHALAGAYALDALPRDEEAVFERHLVVCDRCAREVAELREAAASLGEAVAEPPPPAMRARVLSAALDTPQESLAQPAARASVTDIASRMRPVLATAAAVLVVALLSLSTAVVMLTDRASDLAGELAQARELLDVLAQADLRVVDLESPAGTQARLLYDPAGDDAAVVLAGLEELPVEQAYQLWVLHADTALPDRVFRPDGDGRAVVSVEHGVADADVVAVTVEPRDGSTEPTTDPFIHGGLDADVEQGAVGVHTAAAPPAQIQLRSHMR